MKSVDYDIVNIQRVCLKPIEDKKGETILNRLIPINNHKRLELVRIGILAGPKDENPKFDTYEEIKIKVSFSSKNPRTIYCICEDPSKMKNTKKFTWSTMDRVIKGLKKGMKNHPELRFYIDYLLLLDKGDLINQAYVMAECKKLDRIASDSEVGLRLTPEIKPLDITALYSISPQKNYMKQGYWKKFKKDEIQNISKNFKDFSFVEAKYVKTKTRNLFDSDVFIVRGCDAKEYTLPMKIHEPLPYGKCYEIDKKTV